jgi:1,2-diacylglycerol 3-beta-galactosyltransferase
MFEEMAKQDRRRERARVLILFSDTGGGHRSAAEAITEALELRFPGRYTTVMVDAFKDYAPRPLNRAPQAYPGMARHPYAWGFSYRISNGHSRARMLTGATWPYVRRAAQRLVWEHPADVVVSVHPLFIAPVIKALGRPRPPFLTVVTDLVSTHALWYHRLADQCLVPTDWARRRGLACGLDPSRVRVVGLPVAQRFCQPAGDRQALRAALGWPADLPMVLIVGGMEGMGPLGETAQAIAAGGGDFGISVIAGRNERLRQRLEAMEWPVPTFVYGFERRMPEMMQAASILVTKAGPGTITEAVNAGLPMVLYSRVPGQEDGNVAYVFEEGVGLWAPGAERTASAVRDWLAHPEVIARAAASCRRIARPGAALEIADIIGAAASQGVSVHDGEAVVSDRAASPQDAA